ncbi:hypothetical protein [uncultured Mailhella sp.]|uniref:hypothetical protein n=1 Tax=uncultured Mailhella sp. TaxID=1981031 RepID=UPI0025FA0E83|nr:hypothetical protein [uncultured Mailhella sp.]
MAMSCPCMVFPRRKVAGSGATNVVFFEKCLRHIAGVVPHGGIPEGAPSVKILPDATFIVLLRTVNQVLYQACSFILIASFQNDARFCGIVKKDT